MFRTIDLKAWPRAEMFCYFSQMAPTGYSLTVNLDITEMMHAVKERKLKFFPAYLWLVTRNLNRQTEFRCAMKDGVLGYYDTLTPLYASWHEETRTFSLMWTEFRDNFSAFYAEYIENQVRYGARQGVLCRPELPPENAYTVSALPWVEFTHFAVHSYENKPYFFPSVEAGRYHEENGRIILPFSMTCHHATTDGWHVSRFLEDMKTDILSFGDYLEG